ncbi:hypothetical protein [Nocardia brasiliensis]|nr:hypothetical protein [Nocardia brasiliensis]
MRRAGRFGNSDGTRGEVHAAMYSRFDDGRIEEYVDVVPPAAATP